MATEDAVGIQTRAMTEAQRMENEAQEIIDNNQEEGRAAQDTGEIAQDPEMNPVVEVHKNKDVIIKEYIQHQGGISLDWYVLDFKNTQVKTLIKERVKCVTQRGRILFTCPPLNEFFPTSTFELDLATGHMYTFLTPSEDIGIPCQQEEFDLELLARKLQNDPENSEMCEEELIRIPCIKKEAAPADCMDLEEVENKYRQYMQLWILYADISIELSKKTELSKESAVNACKVYGPYITDILRQVEEVIKLFSMEKELRKIRNRGEFPVPKFTPEGIRIMNTKDKDRVLTQVDRECEDILRAIRRNKVKYEKEQEEAKNRDQQLRLTRQRQTDRSDFNFFNVINSTPIRNNNPRSDQPTVHFDANPVRHHYTPTNPTMNTDWYEPPINDSIIQGATSAPTNQYTTNTMEGTGHNEPWRYNNGANNNVSRWLMKNIKIFDGTNKAECITWLSQIEAAASFSNKPFRELICQSMAPSMLHILSELPTAASDEDIKNAILTNYSDIPSTTEAATRLQNMQTSPTEPLVTFNHRYEAIHRVAFSLSPNEQYNKIIIVEYAKKLPQNTRDKLLRKIAKKNSYIRTLEDAFKQAIEFNRETSFVEAASGCYSEQNNTRIDTQINELDDSFQDCDINTMNTRVTNRSTDGSHNGSFDRSGSRNSSLNSSYNSRPSYRNNTYSNNSDTYNRHGYNRDNNRNRGYQSNNRYNQKSQSYQNRYDNNQDRYRYDNRWRPNKYQHHRNQPKAQIIFEYSDQNMSEMLKTVRNFIDCMKANPTTREQFKTNKLTPCKEYNNEINESEINASNLDQVQQLINEDKDIVFDALVAADYIDEVDCTDGPNHQQA